MNTSDKIGLACIVFLVALTVWALIRMGKE